MNKEKLPLKLTSLLIALLLFFSVNDIYSDYFSPNQSVNTSTSWVKNVPVEVNYNKDDYYVLGIPDKVDVKVSGSSSTIQKITTENNLKAKLDLSNVNIGDEQKIKVEIAGISEKDITAVGDPEFITVSVRERATREFQVIPKIKTERLLIGYSVKDLHLEQKTVRISGAKETINNIYEVRAESDSKTKISANTKEEVKFVAYDRNFNKIEDIDIEKNSTTLDIELETIQKNIQVSINKVDSLQKGFVLEEILVEPNNVILRTETLEILDKINEVFVDVELSSIDKEITELKNLKVYANTTEKYSVESPTVNVTIKLKKDKA